MKVIKSITVLFVLVFLGPTLSAQEMTAKKYNNPQWYKIEHIQFVAGKADDAKKIIKDYFHAASDKAGTPNPVMEINLASGEYDYLVIWKMQDGVEELNWQNSPDDIKWIKALSDMTGGQDKAMELYGKFMADIKSVKTEIGRLE
ncbi:MAG: hypothetical protein WCD31_04665 [Gillisia sp.]